MAWPWFWRVWQLRHGVEAGRWQAYPVMQKESGQGHDGQAQYI